MPRSIDQLERRAGSMLRTCFSLLPLFASATFLTACSDGDVTLEQEPISIETFSHSVTHTFSVADVQGGFDGKTQAEDSTIVCGIDANAPACATTQPIIAKQTGETLYPVDSEFGFYVEDFVGGAQKIRDQDHAEGWVNDIDQAPNGKGLMVANSKTDSFLTPARYGSWCTGLGGALVKCSSEHYTTFEHVLTCNETVPYTTADPSSSVQKDLIDPETNAVVGNCADARLDNDLKIVRGGSVTDESLTSMMPGVQMAANESTVRDDIAIGKDYSISLKDDGKPLYRWGNAVKRPNDIRMYARMALPDTWKQPGENFIVFKAELIVNHEITNNPNDQLRPEDMENEAATGRLPAYTVSGANWLSDKDCYEGDGNFIPAGTLFKNAAFAQGDTAFSSDLRLGLTNAWYTSIDRDPFEAGIDVGPRWRLGSNKFGQDLPSLEIPSNACTQPPFKHDTYKYATGTEVTTTIDLLDFDGTSPLATSLGWVDARSNDINLGVDGDPKAPNGISINGLPLTEDFDLGVYIKGDAKGTRIYNATLNIEYAKVTYGE
jgi:hypothetical protein